MQSGTALWPKLIGGGVVNRVVIASPHSLEDPGASLVQTQGRFALDVNVNGGCWNDSSCSVGAKAVQP